MRVLVTGGAGFIGSAVCRRLVAESGWTVLNFDVLTYAASLTSLAAIENHPNYSFVKGDICDRATVDATLAAFAPGRDHASGSREPRRSLHHRFG